MTKDLQYYISCFQRIRYASRNGEKAPHKFIVLLTVIRGIEDGWISSNFIPLSNEFESAYYNVWHERIGVSVNFHDELHQGFFNLQREPFWILCPWSEGGKLNQCVDLHSLKSVYEGAKYDEELFTLLTIDSSREQLKQTLIELVSFSSTNSVFDVEAFMADLQISATQKDVDYYKQAFDRIANTDKGSKRTVGKLSLLLATIDYLQWRKNNFDVTRYFPLLANWEGCFLTRFGKYLEIKRTSTAFSGPFLALDEDIFWHNVAVDNFVRAENSHDFMTFEHLQDAYEGVEIEEELFQLLMNPRSCEQLKVYLEKLLSNKKKVERHRKEDRLSKKSTLIAIPTPINGQPIFEHSLDYSFYNYGCTIDKKFHQSIFDALGGRLERGQRANIVVLYDNKQFSARFENVDRHGVASDTIRCMWMGKSDDKLSTYLQAKFPESKTIADLHDLKERVPAHLLHNAIFYNDGVSFLLMIS